MRGRLLGGVVTGAVEAGPDHPDGALPDDLRDGTRNSMLAHDWGFHYRPTPGRDAWRFPRGKVVGGSSAVNTCVALRGQPHDYDEWASMGLRDWSWKECLAAFKDCEQTRFLNVENFDNTAPVLQLSVRDDGPGIAPDERYAVLDAEQDDL